MSDINVLSFVKTCVDMAFATEQINKDIYEAFESVFEIANQYRKNAEKFDKEKFELIKLIERNQLAWNNSTDKDMGVLPEVYLSNQHLLDKVKG